MKKGLKKFLEMNYVAAAFAEEGEHKTAIRMAEVSDVPKNFLYKFKNNFSTQMNAATFAEANCPEYALQHLAPTQKHCKQKSKDNIKDFLDNVGLQHARICYGWTVATD
ncbi:MAG: hypothetical protein ACLFMR_00050 [Desulfohalobiaceae bacterium]